MLRKQLVTLARLVAAKVLRRNLLLLPVGGQGLLPLRYTYRADREGRVRYQAQVAGSDGRYCLYTAAYDGGLRPTPGQPCFRCDIPSLKEGDVLEVNLLEPGLRLNDRPIPGALTAHEPARKFIATLGITADRGPLTRYCTHYLPCEQKSIGRDYYFGDDYVDYPEQQRGVLPAVVGLVRQHCPGGRLLEVGCALGLYLRAFLDAGFDAYGVDVSEYAVAEAAGRVGPERARVCNVDVADIPLAPPFDVLFLWDVLEHSADPGGLLAKVSGLAAPGSHLFIHTSNAESLTHRVLGADWEAYSDYSHYGVEKVAASSLRAWLRALGWQVVRWDCADIWVEGADPVLLALGEAFRGIPELATLLAERDLGDFLTVVAARR
jgi:2-polyprenyl-3-methyl-5-hydroxy-6-metoxy-1,4-benzoquinol methylase